MKKAEICPVDSTSEVGYAWEWRCLGGKTKSAGVFQTYFECLEDARKAGYEVELTRAQGMTAPGGAGSLLR